MVRLPIVAMLGSSPDGRNRYSSTPFEKNPIITVPFFTMYYKKVLPMPPNRPQTAIPPRPGFPGADAYMNEQRERRLYPPDFPVEGVFDISQYGENPSKE
jgi:hypothetical protein